jgi:hypothetical protein
MAITRFGPFSVKEVPSHAKGKRQKDGGVVEHDATRPINS